MNNVGQPNSDSPSNTSGVQPMSPRHAHAVARLHITTLTTRLTGRTGQSILRHYYSELSQTPSASVGFVWIEADEIAGFVCAVWDRHALLRKLLTQRAVPLALAVSRQIVIHPQVLVAMWDRLMSDRKGMAQFRAIQTAKRAAELRPIAVDVRFRGQGIATKLVDALASYLREQAFGELYLVAEKENVSANRLYRKYGFSLIHAGPELNRYLLKL